MNINDYVDKATLDLAKCQSLGERRMKAGQRLTKHTGFDNGKREQFHINGVMGEVSFMLMAGIQEPYAIVERSIFTQSGGNYDSPDIVLGGKTIDVKTSGYFPCHLLVPQYKYIRCDLYVLMCIRKERIFYLGCMEYNDIVKPERLFKDWNLPCYRAHMNELYDLPIVMEARK